ncbi:thioesterase-like superfamily-domain-containing protein [Cantharellus anzutake]|uniref:thioesterase-like superfamily-domain-containing protein n=1 Tax=Cantharellus anzutake TaxID=1750568 RepID=UPI00190453F5|nr:thioesterase-like superfamily-domain-containing protein [Cantharellus anzutake]KAF8334333.1 thioesterase-like superfamily-domain-containing protein [Cantharellus anzutake]
MAIPVPGDTIDPHAHQIEHQLITASLELEKLDENLFRSPTKSLWVPARGRGVFGGQVISQALLAASKTVRDDLHCHSLHCYFLLNANPSIPILYYVDRVREGRSYATRGVKAVQKGRSVFAMMVSFSRLEPEGPVDILQRRADAVSDLDRKAYLLRIKQDRINSPIEIRIAIHGEGTDKHTPAMYWMRARSIPKFDAPFQKCILAYISDLNFLHSVTRAVLSNPANSNFQGMGMMASLDHSLWFYDHEFDCSEWVLFVMGSPRAGLGRGVVQGVFYDQSGKLIAVAAQEGVARGVLKRSESDKPKL